MNVFHLALTSGLLVSLASSVQAGKPTCPEAGHVESVTKISQTAGGFEGVSESADWFGGSIASIGDLDGDGVADVAVGASGDDDGADQFAERGAVWILFLNSNGTVRSHQKISDTSGGLAGELDDGDRFGWSVAPLGDFDGDGVPDIVVGAPGKDAGSGPRGAVSILLMNADGTVRDAHWIADGVGGFSGVLDDQDQFGSSVTAVGDLDGDGVTELAVGARLDDDGGVDRGAIWILFLTASGEVKAHQKVSTVHGAFGGETNDGDALGKSVAAIGDLDQDGIGDLVTGARDSVAGPIRGAVWVLFLNSDGTIKAWQKIANGVGGFPDELADYDNFGYSVAAASDLDGDGIVDLLAGAIGDDESKPGAGAIWVMLLTRSGDVRSAHKVGSGIAGFYGDLDFNDAFGAGLAAIRPLEGHASPVAAVGAPNDDDGGTNLGAVWLLFLNHCEWECVGDTNGDGSVDFVDLNVVLAGFNTFGQRLPGDVDDDGDVDFADLNVIISAFNTMCGG